MSKIRPSHWLVFRKDKLAKTFVASLIVTLVPISIYILLIQNHDIRQSLSMYVFDRLLHRVNQDPTTDIRLYSLMRTGTELIPSFIIIAIILTVAYFNKTKAFASIPKKAICFFLLLSAAYICPLMLTMVQKGMYLSPGFPYLAMALSLIIIPFIRLWVSSIKVNGRFNRSFFIITVFLFVGVVIYSCTMAGKIPKHQVLIRDAYSIGKVVPPNSIVTIPMVMYSDFDFVMPGFLMRYDHISLSPYKQYDFYLQGKEYPLPDPKHFRKVPIVTESWDLYKYKP